MIFAAVNGYNKKGIDFLKDAVKNGATAVLCDKNDIKQIKEKGDKAIIYDYTGTFVESFYDERQKYTDLLTLGKIKKTVIKLDKNDSAEIFRFKDFNSYK